MAPPAVPVSVASVAVASVSLSPFGGVLPETPVVPLTHSPAEPVESEPNRNVAQSQYRISQVGLPGCPHPVYQFLRQWTPAFVPSLEGAAALALALWLLASDPHLGANLAGLGGVSTLFAIYLAGGALFGVSLYFARSDSAWLVTLLVGGFALPGLIVAPLFGTAYGAISVAGAFILALLFLGLLRTEVGEDHVAFTRLFGRYFRIVRAAHFLRLPFERTAALLEVGERAFTTPAVYAEVESPTGILYRARATCTATYSLLAAEAHHVAPILASWEHDLEQQALRALHEALIEWATHATVIGSPPPRGALARDVMDDVRSWAQRHGIWLMRVRIHNIWLEPLGGTQWTLARPMRTSAALPPGAMSGSLTGTPFGGNSRTALHSAPAPLVSPSLSPAAFAHPSALLARADEASPFQPRSTLPTSPTAGAAPLPATVTPTDPTGPMETARQMAMRETRPSEPPRHGPGANPSAGVELVAGTGASGAPPVSTDALVAAYEEVRQGRVTDPRTIREIAQAFRFVAENSLAAGQFPYDGHKAARVLREYAARLEQ